MGVWADGQMRNEGSSTALVAIAGDDVGLDKVWAEAPDPQDSSQFGYPLPQQGGLYLLAPGEEAVFTVHWWRPSHDWISSPEGQTPTTSLTIAVRGAVEGGPVDTCVLRFGALPFVRQPGRDGWMIANGNPAASAPSKPETAPVAEIGLIRRAYPRGRLFRR